MTVPFSFEIKVAIIGPVSSGKSTLINALLVGKYSEVSVRRTTACVNFFHLNNTPQNAEESEGQDTRFEQEEKILQLISKDNKDFRNDEANVKRRTLNVDGVEICNCRKDTKVVIVDIPGINEADSGSKYRNYVSSNWHDFDLVLFIMDARHGVNSEEQVELLNFIKSNLSTKKNIPVIILFNKIDELDFNEQETILDEAQSKVSSLFGIPEDISLVNEITEGKLNSLTDLKNTDGTYMPIVLPISIRNGYVYRLASKVDEARFCRIEKGLLEFIGKEQLGLRQWGRLSQEQKYQEAYRAISDPNIFEEGLRSSNFAAFSELLAFCIGGDDAQCSLIESQLEIAVARLQPTFALAEDVESIWKKRRALGAPSSPATFLEDMGNAFWERFAVLRILNVLIKYHNLIEPTLGKEKGDAVIDNAVSYINMVYCENISFLKKANAFERMTFFEETLAMAGNEHFSSYFGKLKLILEVERQSAIFDLITTQKEVKHNVKNHSQYGPHHQELSVNETSKEDYTWSYKDGDWTASGTKLPAMYSNPSNPYHCGHMFWLFCQWMDRVKT